MSPAGIFSASFSANCTIGRVEIDRRRVLQLAGLLADAFDDLRMAMADADRDDAGEGIEIPPARLVPHVLHVAFDDHQRIAVVRDDAGRQILMPQGEHLVARGAVVRGRRVVDDRQRSDAIRWPRQGSRAKWRASGVS